MPNGTPIPLVRIRAETEKGAPKATLATARAELERAEPSTPRGCSLHVEAGGEPGAELAATARTGDEEHAA